jgi:hypothetical protein
MKKSPVIGAVTWVIVTKDNEPGTAQPKRVTCCDVTEIKGGIDPETAAADFHGIRASDGDWYPWDEVFDTESQAKRYAASQIRAALKNVRQRLKANLAAERRLVARLEKLTRAQ